MRHVLHSCTEGNKEFLSILFTVAHSEVHAKGPTVQNTSKYTRSTSEWSFGTSPVSYAESLKKASVLNHNNKSALQMEMACSGGRSVEIMNGQYFRRKRQKLFSEGEKKMKCF